MYTTIQLIDAAAALWPRRLYDDEKPSAVRSLLLAAQVDFQAHHSGSEYEAWIDTGEGVKHFSYHHASGLVGLATQELKGVAFSTDTHRAMAIYRAARALAEKKIRGVEIEAIKTICEAASKA